MAASSQPGAAIPGAPCALEAAQGGSPKAPTFVVSQERWSQLILWETATELEKIIIFNGEITIFLRGNQLY